MTTFDRLLDRPLRSPIFPEPVRVIRVERAGTRHKVTAEGLTTRRIHQRMLDGAAMDALTQLVADQRTDFAGDPELFALGVEARRIQLGYTFDPFFAVSASRIDPLPHQLEAVYGVLLKRPRIRFLLADDPGAGKTVMGGLLLKELRYRKLLDRVLIVTPANLTDQWRREMHDKFGETFQVINRDVAGLAYGENPWEEENLVVTSVDFAKRDEHLDNLRRVHWDLVIVDESHRLSATKYGSEIKRSQRYKLGEVLAQTSAHMLLLTATPHQGDDEKFRLLLELLEPDLFATTGLLREAAGKGENPIMLRRLKEDMTDFDGKPLFPPRYVHTPQFRLSPSERALYDRVTDYVTKHFRKAWDDRRRNVGLAMTVLQRRLASSSYAINRSLENRLKRLQALRDDVNKLADDPYLGYTEDELEDLPEEERWELEDRLAERLTLARNLPQLEAEIRELESLGREARTLAKLEQDRKLLELLKVLGKLNGEKLLVFTEHKDTLNFLVGVLHKQGYAVTHIDGSMGLEERVGREHEFRDSAQVMVATEAAGEGINLQFCSVMVNYDLPWNPTRLEQRMGRIHRYGQKYEVNIHNLIAEGTREGDVLTLVLQKLEVMREQLGSDRVYDVVGELLGDVDLEQLMLEHLLGRRSLAEIQAMVSARLSPDRVEYLKEVTLEALAKRDVDLSRLRADREQSELTRIQPEYTARFFVQALEKLGGRATLRQDGLYTMRVPYELRSKAHNVRSEYPKTTFDKRAAYDADFLAPGHPLFDLVLQETLALAQPVMQRGATFELDGLTGDALLGFYELAVVDGQGSTASRRLFAVQQRAEEMPTLVSPRLLVDALPAPQGEGSVPDGEGVSESLENWLLETQLEPYENEVRGERLREVDIRHRYGTRSLEHLLRESTRKLTQHKLKAAQGDDMKLAITQEERRLRGLQERQRAFLAELEQESQLIPEPAQPLALAYLRPLQPTTQNLPNEDDPAVRKAVELAGMRVAEEYERTQGRTPADVSAENVGYDIRSVGKVPAASDLPQETRYIEVKGRAGVGPVVLTPNEWITAGRLKDGYFLYVVTNALSANPTLTIVRNPAANLTPGQEVTVLHYVISTEEWQRAGARPQEHA
ncbi:superfamily II DNA or RNA helicase [Deinococcus sp. HSC-46F16]|uniref:helicase-related protein n=1 Tax=Deinococcus sp. HSC-46F16 TaxID=2910968 RepID=UPI00209E44FB|nr:helicase-related protein [Deinococcus sp. HSC-46F16]MCP2014388.1 superfamily II DNA or RNA helicase [Deinococcus sp. HSC-46F16]